MNEMLGKNDIVHDPATLPDFDALADEVLARVAQPRRAAPRPPQPAPASPTAAIETRNVKLFRGLLPTSLLETFNDLIRQVAYDAFEAGQDEVGMCCGCSGTENPFKEA